METADRNTKSFKSTEPALRKFTSYSARVREKYSCYSCGRTNHWTTECKFKDACGKKGHIAPAYRSKAKSLQPTHSLLKSAGVAQGRSKKNHRRTHHVHKEVDASISDIDASSREGYPLHKLHDHRIGLRVEFLEMSMLSCHCVRVIPNLCRQNVVS